MRRPVTHKNPVSQAAATPLESLTQAINATAQERLAYLMQSWDLQQPMLIGQVSTNGGTTPCVSDIRNLKGERLEYPFAEELPERCLLETRGVPVPHCPPHLLGYYVTLSFALDEKHQENFQNPFLIRGKTKTLQPLTEFPEGVIAKSDSGSLLIADAIVAHVAKQREQEIAKEVHENLQQVQQLEHRADTLRREIAVLEAQQGQLMQPTEQALTQLRERAHWLRRFSLLSDEDYSQIVGDTTVPATTKPIISLDGHLNGSLRDVVSCIQLYLFVRKLYYPRYLLEDFLTLLRTNDLIILAGAPGSGKTQLTENIAAALNGVARVIPVKPNWSSSDDLLGFYNPIHECFVETDFTGALLDAANDTSRLHLICLDEMNLARVEHYFADFLSRLETRHQQPEITLYSRDIWEAAKMQEQHIWRILQRYPKPSNGGDSEPSLMDLLSDSETHRELLAVLGDETGGNTAQVCNRLRRTHALVHRFQHAIKVPSNVRFIGTVNIDESTHNLSPKLMDRAHVLRFPSALDVPPEMIADEIKESPLPAAIQQAIREAGGRECSAILEYHLDDLFPQRTAYPEPNEDDPLTQILFTWAKDYLAPLGVELSYRTVRQACHYRNLIVPLYGASISNTVALNNIVLHKVLPRLAFRGNDTPSPSGNSRVKTTHRSKEGYVKSFASALKDELQGVLDGQDMPAAYVVLSDLVERAAANDWEFHYWL